MASFLLSTSRSYTAISRDILKISKQSVKMTAIITSDTVPILRHYVDWSTWFIYIKKMAEVDNVWEYIDPEDTIIPLSNLIQSKLILLMDEDYSDTIKVSKFRT